MKCQMCREHDAVTSWQPFGPAENCRDGDAFMAFGSHYRGYPVMKICEDCQGMIQNGENISFEYGYEQTEYLLMGELAPITAPKYDKWIKDNQ